MNNSFRAQCQCGQLVLTFTQPPAAQLVCHCQDCRSIGGKPFASVAFFKAEEGCEKGDFTAQDLTGGSGKPKQYRSCKSCGEFVYATVDALKGLLGVGVERFNPPFEFKPMAHVWTSEKVEGVTIPEGVMQFPKGPPFRPGR